MKRSRKKSLAWRPANALAAGATSRAAWSKGGGKRGKNPRSASPARGPRKPRKG